MLHGDGGLGKSYLSLKLAEQMLRPEGGELFGKKIHHGSVVILDGENAEIQIHHRIHNTTIIATAPLKVYSVNEPILGYEEKTNALFAWLAAEHNPRLVIIDSQRALWAGDEKEQLEVGRMLRAFAKALEAFPFATLLLHHDNRGKDYAGSSDTNAAISGARLHLEKHGTKDETQARRLSMPKNRIGPEMLPQKFFLTIETQPASHRHQISGIGIRAYESSAETMAADLVEQAKTKILNQTCTSEELWVAFGWEISNHEPQKREHRDVWRIIRGHLEDGGYVHGRVAGHGNRNLWRPPGIFHDLA
jgi:RecA-family ATPase